MLKNVLAGAGLISLNAVFLTVIAAVSGEPGQVGVGLRHIAGLMACGGAGGIIYNLVSQLRIGSERVNLYGRWVCGGVTAIFATVPVGAVLTGQSVSKEVIYFLSTPAMVLLYLVGGALSGYMAGRWFGELESVL